MNANSGVCTPSTRITWKIDNFSNISSNSVYSDAFCVDGYNWKLLIFPKGNNVDHLSMYLYVVDDSKVLPLGWSIKADFSMSVINQFNGKDSVKKVLGVEHIFNAKGNNWGFPRLILLSDFNDPSKGYLVNDSCVVEADIWVSNPKGYETWPSQLKMAKIDIRGEEIKVTKAEIKKRAKAVTLLTSSIASGTNLLVRSEASLMADPKIGSDISSSLLLLNDEKQMSAKGIEVIAEEAKSGLVQAIARQEFLIRQLLTKEDKVKNAETEVNRFRKETEQYATELMEVKAKRSDLESEVEQLHNSLIEEKQARKKAESIAASMAELKEKCLDVYSAGYMACEKEMKRLAVEKGFLDILPDLDNDESTNEMEKIKEAKTDKIAVTSKNESSMMSVDFSIFGTKPPNRPTINSADRTHLKRKLDLEFQGPE